MSIIYIGDFGFKGEIIKYNYLTGEHYYSQLPPGQKRARGFFLPVDKHIFGYHASLDGPVFFWDGNRINLKDHSVAIEFRPTESVLRQIVIIKIDDETIIDLEYKPDIVSDGFGLMPQEDSDFFAWLKIELTDPDFISYFTAPPETPPMSADDIPDLK